MQGIDAKDFALRLGADPSNPARRSEAMALGDGAQDALRRAQAFEQALSEALAVPVPAGLEQRLQAIAAPTAAPGKPWFVRGPWLALAASLLLVIGFASANLLRPSSGAVQQLGMAAIEHLTHEPFALMSTEPVPADRLARLMNDAGLVLAQAVAVHYASPCPVYGQRTLHMVVQQPGGPVSLIYFPQSDTQALGEFRFGGTQGRAIAFGDGMLVLLGANPAAISHVQSRWQAARVAALAADTTYTYAK